MRSVLRLLLDTSTQSAHGFPDTTTKNLPPAAPANRTSHKSTTSLFIIYMAIGFSVTFACILALMVVYHCCRRSWFPLIAAGGHHTQSDRRSSSQGGHSHHELKQLFVVQHPGGSANLAFREDEELKPYKKKSQAILLSASLDDSSFTIPARKANAESDVPDISQCIDIDITPEHEVQDREGDMLLDDTGSDMMTESMLTASSDIIVADDLDDVSMLKHPSSPSTCDTAGQAVAR